MPNGTLRTFVVPFESTLSVAIGLQGQDVHQIRRMTSLLKPFRDAHTQLGCPVEELDKRLVECITKLESASGVNEAFSLVTSAVHLPELLVVSSIKTFRSTYDRLAATDAQLATDDLALALLKGISRREKRIQAHASLQTQATNPLPLAVKDLSAVAGLSLTSMGLMSASENDGLLEKVLRLWTEHVASADDSGSPGSPSPVGTAPLGTPGTLGIAAFLAFLHRSTPQMPFRMGVRVQGQQLSPGGGPNGDEADNDDMSDSLAESSASFADNEIRGAASFCFQPILSGCCSVERLKAAFQDLGLGRGKLLLLYLEWLFSLPLYCLLRHPVIEGAQSVLGVIIGLDNSNRQSDRWAEIFRKKCSETDHIASALIASLLARVVSSSISPGSLGQWERHIAQLQDAVFLQLVLQARGTSAIPVDRLRSPGRVSDVISNHIIALSVSPNDIQQNEDAAERFELPASTNSLWKSVPLQLQLLRIRMPICTSPTTLSLRCATKCIDMWLTHRADMTNLRNAVNFISHCESPTLRQAWCHSLWVQHVRKPYGVMYDLVEKVGKAPKDRLCQKHLDLDYANAVVFAHTAHVIMTNMETASASAEELRHVPPLVDLLWQGGPEAGDLNLLGKHTIGEGIGDSRSIYDEIVHHHKLLCYTMALILRFQMRFRPSPLFPARTRTMFFASFTTEHPSIGECDPGVAKANMANRVHDDPDRARLAADVAELQSTRRQFLMRVLDEVVLLQPAAVVPDEQPITTKHVFSLANEFGLPDDDQLRRVYVRSLFQNGRAAEAKEVLGAVIDMDTMATMLLDLGVRQLAVFIDPTLSEDAMQLVSKLPGYVYEWCRAAATACPRHTHGIPKGAAGLAYVVDMLAIAKTLATAACQDAERISRLCKALGDVKP